MIRSTTIATNALTIRSLNACDCLIFNGAQIQSVRWKRKPIWLPTAKSKIFRIPVRKFLPPEELTEMQRLHNNYKTTMHSLKLFFIEKDQKVMKTLNVEVVEENQQKDFEICSYLNDRWNMQVAAARNERIAKERKDRAEEIAMKLKEKEQRDLAILERVDKEIRKAKEIAPTFITRDNIDEAIENALNTIVNHNAAIDANGNFYTDEPGESVSSNTMN